MDKRCQNVLTAGTVKKGREVNASRFDIHNQ